MKSNSQISISLLILILRPPYSTPFKNSKHPKAPTTAKPRYTFNPTPPVTLPAAAFAFVALALALVPVPVALAPLAGVLPLAGATALETPPPAAAVVVAGEEDAMAVGELPLPPPPPPPPPPALAQGSPGVCVAMAELRAVGMFSVDVRVV